MNLLQYFCTFQSLQATAKRSALQLSHSLQGHGFYGRGNCRTSSGFNNLFDTNSENEKTKPLCLSKQSEESHL